MVICMLPPTAKCDVIYSTRSSSKVNHPEARKEPETVHVLNPIELKAMDQLSIGDTKLMFVPLCSEKFHW